MSEAEILLDRPPGGWGDLVTNHTLDLRFDAFEARMDAKMDRRFAEIDAKFTGLIHELRVNMETGFRNQTWAMISTIIAAMAIMVAVVRL